MSFLDSVEVGSVGDSFVLEEVLFTEGLVEFLAWTADMLDLAIPLVLLWVVVLESVLAPTPHMSRHFNLRHLLDKVHTDVLIASDPLQKYYGVLVRPLWSSTYLGLISTATFLSYVACLYDDLADNITPTLSFLVLSGFSRWSRL